MVVVILGTYLESVVKAKVVVERQIIVYESKEQHLQQQLSKLLMDENNDINNATVEKCVTILKEYPQLVNIPFLANSLTPFQRACQLNNTTLIYIMLNCGGNIFYRTSNNSTPFHIAVYTIAEKHLTDFSSLELLLQAGSDINAERSYGFTSIQIASLMGHLELCKYLLLNGANPMMVNQDGLMAADLSDIVGKSDVSSLIESFMRLN